MLVFENQVLNFMTAVTQNFHSDFKHQDLINSINTFHSASSLMLLEKTGTMNLPTLGIPATNTSEFIDIYF